MGDDHLRKCTATLSDYKRACSVYAEMERDVGNGEWRSTAALRLLALGVEIRFFQTNYEAANGYPPMTCDSAESAPKQLPERCISAWSNFGRTVQSRVDRGD
jgi:hypothetical protein